MTADTNREIRETVVVRVSTVGSMGEGVGTADVTVNFDTMTDAEIGRAMAQAFRHALTPAIEEYSPLLGRRWADQGRSESDPRA